MTKKYIELEAVIAAIEKPKVTPGGVIFDALKKACQEEVRNLPVADVVEVKHGQWTFQTYEYMPWCTKAICSSCKQTIANNADLSQDWGKRLFLKDNLFCSKCGAKMDGVIYE